jgi:protein-disulfide isomerase
MMRTALAWLAAGLLAAVPCAASVAGAASSGAASAVSAAHAAGATASGVASVVNAAGAAVAKNSAAASPAATGHAAAASSSAPRLPAFSALDGKAISPAQLAGKTTVVAFFSSTCPFCMNEAPKLQKLYRDNRQVLNVVSVNIEAGDPTQAAKAAAWVRKYGLTHPVTLNYRAFEAVLGKPKGIPALYVFDRDGRLVRSEIGEMLDEDFGDIARDARKP